MDNIEKPIFIRIINQQILDIEAQSTQELIEAKIINNNLVEIFIK